MNSLLIYLKNVTSTCTANRDALDYTIRIGSTPTFLCFDLYFLMYTNFPKFFPSPLNDASSSAVLAMRQITRMQDI